MRRIHFIDEQDTSPLKTLQVNGKELLKFNPTAKCSEKKARVSSQACDGRWTQHSSSAVWGLQLTKNWAGEANYMLEVGYQHMTFKTYLRILKVRPPIRFRYSWFYSKSTGYLFSRAWHWLRVLQHVQAMTYFPRLSAVTFFPHT